MPYIRATLLTAAAAVFFTLLFHLVDLCDLVMGSGGAADGGAVIWTTALIFVFVAMPAVIMAMRRLSQAMAAMETWTLSCSNAIEDWAGAASPVSLRLGVAVLAGCTLFLELVLIRWESGFFPVFALYKNFTLLSCFCGLGIGYAMARKTPLALPACLPTLLLLLLTFMGLRYGWRLDGLIQSLLHVVPVHEEANMFSAVNPEVGWIEYILFSFPVFFLLASTFILNALVLLPAGQFCGYLMQKLPALEGYGYNLLGSIAGVGLLFILSWLWVGPVIWFGLPAVLLAAYLMTAPMARKVSLACLLGCAAAAGWPAEPLVHNIYSPYQLIQVATQPNGMTAILASGTYYQKIYDLSFANANRDANPALHNIVGYYELPFRTAPALDQVAIVGAGSGNDVAAALRCGAQSVDAVEIDPAILGIGRDSHPELPYQNPRVHAAVNDARNFFRTDARLYDALVYGVLDSHIVASYGANLRVDSYVYTREGLRAAFDHLKPGGLMSVAFALPTQLMGEKVFRILKEFPGAGAPVAILTGYDSHNTTTFMVRKGKAVELPQEFMGDYKLADVTEDYEATSAKALDLPTDDWPFFYMNVKMYPGTYVAALGLMLALALLLLRHFLPGQAWRPALLPFAFLGAGFMLVETKAITELGLLFGNTWHVIGVTIVSILIMAYLANILAERQKRMPLMPVFIGLLAVIVLGYVAAFTGSFAAPSDLEKLGIVILLASPMFFSGLIFSTLLKDTKDIGSAMAYNLMGAMLGGALEYNSMQFGFSSLYLIALALYALAWLAMRQGAKTPA